jgi:enamine deaminase RidA (YjgF/YER057c/UK114 family)
MSAEKRLAEGNITRPAPSTPLGNYVDSVRIGNLYFFSGGTSREFEPKGKLGRDLTVEQGYAAARHTGLIFLARVRATLGSLDRVKRVVRVFGMISSSPDFGEQPQVLNGFSDLIVEVFGDPIGKHARVVIGAAVLPGDVPVEVEVTVEVE